MVGAATHGIQAVQRRRWTKTRREAVCIGGRRFRPSRTTRTWKPTRVPSTSMPATLRRPAAAPVLICQGRKPRKVGSKHHAVHCLSASRKLRQAQQWVVKRVHMHTTRQRAQTHTRKKAQTERKAHLAS